MLQIIMTCGQRVTVTAGYLVICSSKVSWNCVTGKSFSSALTLYQAVIPVKNDFWVIFFCSYSKLGEVPQKCTL